VSRTSTAPLDRLKVYLIAQTGSSQPAVSAMKQGDAVQASKQVARPLVDACKALWRAGGMRSLFAGRAFRVKCEGVLIHAGNGLNVVKVMPESAIKFGSYEVYLGMNLSLQAYIKVCRLQKDSWLIWKVTATLSN